MELRSHFSLMPVEREQGQSNTCLSDNVMLSLFNLTGIIYARNEPWYTRYRKLVCIRVIGAADVIIVVIKDALPKSSRRSEIIQL